MNVHVQFFTENSTPKIHYQFVSQANVKNDSEFSDTEIDLLSILIIVFVKSDKSVNGTIHQIEKNRRSK